MSEQNTMFSTANTQQYKQSRKFNVCLSVHRCICVEKKTN